MPKINQLRDFLDERVEVYNQPSFIPLDPISIPHSFTKKQDIEISGLFAATLAWGLRKTTVNKCNSLMQLMDNSPYDFICNYEDSDLKPFLSFKHRTFNATDALFFIAFLKKHYSKNKSLESAFISDKINPSMQECLSYFHDYMFGIMDSPERTKKHVATPRRKSACKRLNMFLRWMVRKDAQGVDFGIWTNLSPAALICPLDVHVDRVARRMNLLKRKQTDWQAAEELTKNLKKLDPLDPVKYDFALFGLGVIEKH